MVGNPINKHGEPYGLTEEFVEVYRLHSLLPETIQIRSTDAAEAVREVPFTETRQAGSAKLTSTTPPGSRRSIPGSRNCRTDAAEMFGRSLWQSS